MRKRSILQRRWWLRCWRSAWCRLRVAAQPPKLDPALPALQGGRAGVSGNLSSIGSDTLNNLMTLWAESFSKFYPNAKIQIEGKGSSTAPPALISRHRAARPDVARDEGHRDRPVREEVRLQADGDPHLGRRPGGLREQGQPDQVPDAWPRSTRSSPSRAAAATRKTSRPGASSASPGEWASKPISLYGRNSASGTYGFFKEHALKNGDYKDEVKEQPGSASVVQGVDGRPLRHRLQRHRLRDRRACARCRSPRRRAASATRPTPDNAYAGSYPLARFLYVYVNKAPGKPLDPLTREFVKLVLSKEGQEVVIKDGYFPIPALHRQGRAEQGPVGGD